MGQKKKVAFICVHNSCRSQMAEALGKTFAGDIFDYYSAGTELKSQVNPQAVRVIKEQYGIEMGPEFRPKKMDDIPMPDILISMGCDVGCPYVGREFDFNWELEDPTGKSDEKFVEVMEEIRRRIREMNT